MTTTADHDFVSVGALCGRIQKSVRSIEQAATELGIQPAMKLNGIPYFDGVQVERITEAVSNQRSK